MKSQIELPSCSATMPNDGVERELFTEKVKTHSGARSGLLELVRPSGKVPFPLLPAVAVLEAGLFLGLWIMSPFRILPSPAEVLTGLGQMWVNQGLGQELAVSFGLNLQALALASAISLGLAYLTVIPVFRPLVSGISKGRFLSLTGFSLIFTLAGIGGHAQKVMLLTFAITVFYVTSMAAVIAAIPRSEFDHARTLRMSEFRVVWEVAVLGTLDKAFEVLRQNAAMGWMMLTMVETTVRSEGGVGLALSSQLKHFMLADVYGIQLLILMVGVCQDYGIEWLKRLVCPHANLPLERK